MHNYHTSIITQFIQNSPVTLLTVLNCLVKVREPTLLTVVFYLPHPVLLSSLDPLELLDLEYFTHLKLFMVKVPQQFLDLLHLGEPRV